MAEQKALPAAGRNKARAAAPPAPPPSPAPPPPPPPPPAPPPEPQTISGLPPLGHLLWYSGINITTYELRNAPMFAPTFANGATVQMRDFFGMDMFYAVPDHITYDTRMASTSQTTGSTMEYETDFSTQFGFDISDSESVEFASVEDDTSFSYKGNLFSDTSKSYEMCYYVCKTASFRAAAGPAPFDPTFLELIQAIAANPPGDPSWTALFDTYGTHWIQACDLGGVFMMQASVDKSTFSSTTETDFRDSFKLSFDDLISSGELSASYYMNNSSFYKQYSETTNIETSSRGGTPGEGEKDFFNSCIYQPTLLTVEAPGVSDRPVLMPMWTLFEGHADLQKQVKAALDYYTGIGAGGVFSDPINLSIRALQQAPCDGILLLSTTTAGDQINISNLDDLMNPIGVYGQCVDYTRTIWMPISMGQTFAADSNYAPSDPKAPTLLLLPIDNGTKGATSAFGAFTTPSLTFEPVSSEPGVQSATFTPPGPGFLALQWQSASPNTSTNGPYINVSQQVRNQNAAYWFSIQMDPKGDTTLQVMTPVFGTEAMEPMVINTNIPTPADIVVYFWPLQGLDFSSLDALGVNYAKQAAADALAIISLSQSSASNTTFVLNQAPTVSAATQPGITPFTTVAMQVGYSQAGLSCVTKGEWVFPSTLPISASGNVMFVGVSRTGPSSTRAQPARSLRRPQLRFADLGRSRIR